VLVAIWCVGLFVLKLFLVCWNTSIAVNCHVRKVRILHYLCRGWCFQILYEIAVYYVIADRTFVSLMSQAWPLLSLSKEQLNATYLRQHIVETAGSLLFCILFCKSWNGWTFALQKDGFNQVPSFLSCFCLMQQLVHIAFSGSSFQSYGASPAIWDHTMLPATQHRWTHPALTPAR